MTQGIPDDEGMSRLFGKSYGGDTGHRGLDGMGFGTTGDKINELKNHLDAVAYPSYLETSLDDELDYADGFDDDRDFEPF